MLPGVAVNAGWNRRWSVASVSAGASTTPSTQAAEDACQLFTVLGPAGIGKSRLVRELSPRVAGRADVLAGRCLPYGEGITYWPSAEMAVQEAGIGRTTPIAGGGPSRSSPEPLEGTRTAGARGPSCAEMIGLGDGGGGREQSGRPARFLEALGRRRPLVVVFDDIHWGEATFLDLVEHVAEWTRDAPVLLVCLARPELLDVRPGWGGGKLKRDVRPARIAVGTRRRTS